MAEGKHENLAHPKKVANDYCAKKHEDLNIWRSSSRATREGPNRVNGRLGLQQFVKTLRLRVQLVQNGQTERWFEDGMGNCLVFERSRYGK